LDSEESRKWLEVRQDPENNWELKKREEHKKRSDEIQEKNHRRPYLFDENADQQKRIEEAWENIDKLQDSGILIYIDKFIEKYPDAKVGTVNFDILKELLKSKQFDFNHHDLDMIITVRRYSLVYNEVKRTVISNNPVNSDECLRNFIRESFNSDIFRNIPFKLMLSQVLADQFDYEGDVEKDIERIKPQIAREKKENELKKFESDLIGEFQTNNRITISYVDRISGTDFEKLLKNLFKKMGYQVIHTPLSHDQGADLILEKEGTRFVVQAKNWTANVGNSAVQEIVPAVKHYQAHKAIVISSSGFTVSAIALAQSNNVELWDRTRLSTILEDNPIYPYEDS